MQQTYQNHVRRVPGFLAVWGLIVFCIVGAGVNLYQSIGDHQRLYSASLILVLSFCLCIVCFYSRSYALKAQDRAIRAEESLRYFQLIGKPIDARLGIGQIIALRFASDAEYPVLAERAINENLSPDAIKRAVKDWRPDTHRV